MTRVAPGSRRSASASVPGCLATCATIARLRRLLGAWRPEVVHAHGLRAGALTALAVAVIRPTAYNTRPALIVTVHNAPPDRGVNGAIYRVLEKIVARSADSVLCVSADLEQRMAGGGRAPDWPGRGPRGPPSGRGRGFRPDAPGDPR